MYKLEMKRWNRNLRIPKSYIFTCENHYENLPMQYTEIFEVVKNEKFQ